MACLGVDKKFGVTAIALADQKGHVLMLLASGTPLFVSRGHAVALRTVSLSIPSLVFWQIVYT